MEKATKNICEIKKHVQCSQILAKMDANDKLCLKRNDFQESIKTSFGELRGDKDFADVTLACEDGELEGHKEFGIGCSLLLSRMCNRVGGWGCAIYAISNMQYAKMQYVICAIC